MLSAERDAREEVYAAHECADLRTELLLELRKSHLSPVKTVMEEAGNDRVLVGLEGEEHLEDITDMFEDGNARTVLLILAELPGQMLCSLNPLATESHTALKDICQERRRRRLSHCEETDSTPSQA